MRLLKQEFSYLSDIPSSSADVGCSSLGSFFSTKAYCLKDIVLIGSPVAIIETEKELDVIANISAKPSLQCMEGFSRARAVFFMMRRDFAELTPIFLLAPLLGDVATPTQLSSPGSGAVPPKKI